MNNRFTLQDLAGILATQTGRTRKESEEFLKEFIAVVVDGAFTDRIVKIKGLGTFKVIEVEDRESINVNTGKRFVIPGHYKFNFTPDKELKELVNKPFSFFDTTEINTEDNPQEIQGENLEIQGENLKKEGENLEIQGENFEEEGEIETEAVETAETIEEKPEPQPAVDIPEKPQTAPRKGNKIGLIVFLILLVAAIGLSVYYFTRHSPQPKFQSAVPVETTQQESARETPEVTAISDNQPSAEPEPAETTPTASTETATSDSILGHITIEPGSRLTLISLEYYQHKIFWVYIYTYNKSLIEDPNNIPVGTKLAIPAPEVYGINANDRESIEKASLLQTEIIAGEK
ncbi:HU family DNA-binding protein [Parabacteroides sp. PF5-6]|uniref:HU family DNA-binding protein n=1 Tax=Parabacteroides sp. PF5-6 TaxID=1742403 RepID=UPI002404B2FE|nr:HU family DNA-binding protein [Parabacteroides sp. PF5-6]MDF9829589.1 nucleoid DNA-binding protein/flagellar basal body-associated protein FliL [Parabacteroides sp. PF5-6]